MRTSALLQPSDLEADYRRLALGWPVPGERDDKYSRGVVGIDTGSARFPGAGVLSTLGAVYAGAGFVRFCGADAARAALLTLAPSVTFPHGRVDVWLVGCGWDEAEDDEARLAARLVDEVPMVLDAGALWVMPDRLPTGSVLTPHPGELARLLQIERRQVSEDPDRYARQAAQRWGTTVLVKGHRQVIASPDGNLSVAIPGPAWTAQAGSGDALAGILAALMAQGKPGPEAAWLAGSIQAVCATRHPGPYPVHEALRFLPGVIAELGGSLEQPFPRGEHAHGVSMPTGLACPQS